MISLFVLSGVIIFLFSVFQKKKNYLIRKQILDKQKFDDEINNLQTEIREETLRNISWELHDNIGQMLTLAKIQLQKVEKNVTIEEVNQTLGNALQSVRELSKSINPEFINQVTLVEAVGLEINRFNRLNFINAKLVVLGEPFNIKNKVEIVLFRILQEFFTNTIKHAQATELEVLFQYKENTLKIKAEENGKGFDISKIKSNGIGISNIEKRGKLIRADIKLNSEIGKGTSLDISYKKQKI